MLPNSLCADLSPFLLIIVILIFHCQQPCCTFQELFDRLYFSVLLIGMNFSKSLELRMQESNVSDPVISRINC